MTRRDTNIEVLRIIAMVMIVFSHSTFGVIQELKDYPDVANTLYQYLISGGGKIGINIFMLISGYFMCQARISLKKLVKLLVWIYFYNLTLGAFLFVIGFESFSFLNIFDFIFPFRKNGINHFTTAYIFFYLSIPFWQILVEHLSKKQHAIFILLGYVCYVLYQDIPIFEVTLDAVVWFGYLFVIAAYIRKYIDVEIIHIISGWATVILLIVMISSVLVLFYWIKVYPIALFSSANSTLALGFSLCLFIWFKGCHIRYNSAINIVAASTFGVLLIHSGSSSLTDYVWHKIIRGSEWFSSSFYIFYIVFSVFALYCICTVIDIAYKKILENKLVDFFYKRIKYLTTKYEVLPRNYTDTM